MAPRAGPHPRRVPIGARSAWASSAWALYGLHFGAWVSSLSVTSVASSVTLVTATPVLLGAIAVVTGRDRPTRRHWMSIGLALVGLSLIGWADSHAAGGDALLGDGLAALGAVAMAFYLLAVRTLGEDLDVLAFSGLTTAVGSATLFVTALVFGIDLTGTEIPLGFASYASLGWTALSALIPQLVGHNLLTWALKHTTPTTVGIATVGEPVGATILAWLWLAEPLTPLVGIGCAITLASVVLSLKRESLP